MANSNLLPLFTTSSGCSIESFEQEPARPDNQPPTSNLLSRGEANRGGSFGAVELFGADGRGGKAAELIENHLNGFVNFRHLHASAGR